MLLLTKIKLKKIKKKKIQLKREIKDLPETCIEMEIFYFPKNSLKLTVCKCGHGMKGLKRYLRNKACKQGEE